MDPFEAANALGRLCQRQEEFAKARQEREAAILECVRREVPLRDVAKAANCSHETIRRMVAADGSAVIEWDAASFPFAGSTVGLLVYKLAGYAQGTFAPDLAKLQAGTGWLTGAGVLAGELSAARGDEAVSAITLDDVRGFALHQVLCLTEMERPSVLAELAEALAARYGYPPYRTSDLRRWTGQAIA
jgi:hypothetical protein